MERLTLLAQDVLEPAVTALRQALGERLVAVVLFGSRARGDARPDSDWDLLIIADELPEGHWKRQRLIGDALLHRPCAGVSVTAKTPQEFEADLAPLYLDIALDGRLLYDPRGYGQRKLDELRRIIERAGLHRERTPAGDVWRWREEPVNPWKLEWEHRDATG